MPAVSFDSKSFLLQSGRGKAVRFPLVAASFDATLIDRSDWSSVLAELRQAGFNSVVIRVPWLIHEPTAGRFAFDDDRSVRDAVVAAGAAGLKVALRIGPCVGGSFARGGLPAWISEFASDRVREANPAFLDRVSRFWRRVADEFVDLQATRNSSGNRSPRPVIAVGIEDDWRCLDAKVGDAYFASLVRFAREVGVEVPLFTANSCWYAHDGMIDGWLNPVEIGRTVDELRQVHLDAPPLIIQDSTCVDGSDQVAGAEWARMASAAVAARSDFVFEVVATRHRGATSDHRRAELPPQETHGMRRALVFASSFAELFASLTPDASSSNAPTLNPLAANSPELSVSTLRGTANERLSIVCDRTRPLAARKERPNAKKSSAQTTSHATSSANASAKSWTHICADATKQIVEAESPSGIDFYASDIVINGARLDRCTGSLVALLGDIVVVAGNARAKLTVKVDGSTMVFAVPADGAAPKAVKVRGLRFVAVTHAMAAGVGIATDAIEFVDQHGAVLVRIAADATVSMAKAKPVTTPVAPALSPSFVQRITEADLLDATHARFAGMTVPKSLGALGVDSCVGYYRARVKGKAATTAVFAHSAGITRIERSAAKAGMITIVAEVCDRGVSATGVFGPLLDLAPLKGVKCEQVMRPAFDATTIGRFVYGYDMRDSTRQARTLRWTFAARTEAVAMRIPDWWRALAVEFGCALRLNGDLLAGIDARMWPEHIVLDGAKLSPMRPTKLAKGEKPPKAKLAKLEAGANTVLLDLGTDCDKVAKLSKEIEFFSVRGEVAAEWAFARVSPPASWASAKGVPKKAAAKDAGVPTWFRSWFRVDAPRALELACAFAVGEVAMVFVNGKSVLVQDGESGVVDGAKRARRLRHATLSASLVRAGENEICVFAPNGVLPDITVS